MKEIARSTQAMISGMSPMLREGLYVFVSTTDPDVIGGLTPVALSLFHEDEGVSLLVPADAARWAGQPVDQAMRCITLNVYSSLEGVGLTAAVATALARHDIACNVIAAFHHDHVFVLDEDSRRALEVLEDLQQGVAASE